MTHLRQLEAESIYIMREVVAQFERPVMLYSIGKDSSVLLHLARKAFHPGRIPFPLMHIDTTWKFREMITFRERMAEEIGFELLVHTNMDGVEAGINPFDHGSKNYTDIMKTQALKQALTEGHFDAAFGGARRDEEKSRAKERVFSFRDRNSPLGSEEPATGAVEPLQRPVHRGESHPGLPDQQLDRARHLAVHPPRGDPDRARSTTRAATGRRP